MVEIRKKMKFNSRSMSGNEFMDLNADISIALEYTGSPINNSMLLKVLPVDVDSVPTAKIAASPVILYNLTLPVVEPIVRRKFRATNEDRLGPSLDDSKNQQQVTPVKNKFSSHDDDVCCGNEELRDEVESSGTPGFSVTSEDHSNELSDTSDMLETPGECNEIEVQAQAQHFGGIFCEEEEASDGEQLECRRRKKAAVVTFCDQESSDVVEDSYYSNEGQGEVRPRPEPVRPPKKGMCYRCHRGNRLTDKEACLVCDAKYCVHCIRRAMGSMPEGRKCLTCIGFPVEDSKRRRLGKCSRIIKGWFKENEIRQIMEAEVCCQNNQVPPESILVNGRKLNLRELMLLLSCSNPPIDLKPGSYWYDRSSGLWGKEGHRPCQIITSQLNIGEPKMKEKCSNGNTNVKINGREITKFEAWMLKSAGVMCEGSPNFWLQDNGTYLLEGMKMEKGNIWGKKKTKILCALLSLPTPESPKPRGKSNRVVEQALSSYLEQKASCKVLLVGNDSSGTSTIYKQARVLYDVPFSKEERESMKFMIQSKMYEYLGRLLEGRELFEEESLLEMRKRQSTVTDPSSSDSTSELQGMTEYTVGQKLQAFSDRLIDVMLSNNLDMIFPAAAQEFAECVEELWNDTAIQATYSRLDELQLPRVASYFLDKAVEIAKEDYEPSDTDIMYAEGITPSKGLASMEFSYPNSNDDVRWEPEDQPNSVTRYQLIRVNAKSLGKNCKWLEMFEDVKVVLFCVSLADYDEYKMDSRGLLTNKMMQSKRLFENIITHPAYKNVNFLLILNKYDLLEEKIEQVPLTRCEWFKDFNPVVSHHQSSRRNGNSIAPLAQRAYHYIGVQFKRLFKSLTGRKLYVCPVTALEPDTVDAALKYAREVLKWEEDNSNFGSLNDFSSESIDNSSYT